MTSPSATGLSKGGFWCSRQKFSAAWQDSDVFDALPRYYNMPHPGGGLTGVICCKVYDCQCWRLSLPASSSATSVPVVNRLHLPQNATNRKSRSRSPRASPSRSTRATTRRCSAFGGIHCLGWSFKFSSTFEQSLWRYDSISIAAIPITFSLSSVSLPILGRKYPTALLGIYYILFLQLSFYVCSRFVLLILPFIALNSLPLEAYCVVHWTSSIPHV